MMYVWESSMSMRDFPHRKKKIAFMKHIKRRRRCRHCTWKQARTHEMEDFYVATSHLARVLCARREERRGNSSEIAKMFLCSFATFHCSVCALQRRREHATNYMVIDFFLQFFFRFSFFIAAPHLSLCFFPSNDCPSHPKVCSAVHAEHMLTLDYWKRKPIRFDVNCWNGSTIDDDGEHFRSIFAELHYALGALSVDEGKICRMPYVNDNLWMCIHLNMKNFSSSHISETTACFDLLLHRWATLEESGMATDLDICDAMQLELLFLGWFPLRICTYTRQQRRKDIFEIFHFTFNSNNLAAIKICFTAAKLGLKTTFMCLHNNNSRWRSDRRK